MSNLEKFASWSEGATCACGSSCGSGEKSAACGCGEKSAACGCGDKRSCACGSE